MATSGIYSCYAETRNNICPSLHDRFGGEFSGWPCSNHLLHHFLHIHLVVHTTFGGTQT